MGVLSDFAWPARLAGIQAAFRIAERVIPERAGRWAEQLFFRVPPPPPLDRRSRRFRSGSPVVAELDGHAVRGMEWGAADAPTVYLVHGWGGWWQQLGVYVEPLAAAGLRVVAYDALSHGESDPGVEGAGRSRLPEIAASLEAMVQACGPAYAVISHSGGAIATMDALRLGVVIDRLVFIAASVHIDDMVDTFRQQWGIGLRTAAVMLQRTERRVGRRMAEFDAAALLSAVEERPPALFVHDRDDRETPARGSKGLAGQWPRAQVLITRGLGHRGVLWAPEVVETVVAFLASGTSGEEQN